MKFVKMQQKLLQRTLTWCCVATYNCTCTFTNIHIHVETSLTLKDNFNNERIHFFIKIYLSHFILERSMFLVCERWVETRPDCYFDPSSSSPIAALLSQLGWGCSTVGHWGPKTLCLQLVLTSASCLQLTRTVRAPDYIIV